MLAKYITLQSAAENPLVRESLSRALSLLQLRDSDASPFALGGQGVLFIIRSKTKNRLLLKIASFETRPPEEHWLLKHDILKEVRVLAAVECPAVPKLVAYDPDGAFLVRQFINGRLLAHYPQAANKTMRLHTLFRLLRTAVPLFEHFHYNPSGCYVLRDLKPANVVIPTAKSTLLKLVDVGSVRPEKDMLSKTRNPHRLGSRKWLFWAPEQILELRQSLDRHADYFSLGATAFYLLTQAPPYDNSSRNPDETLRRYQSQYERVKNILRNAKLSAGLTDFLIGVLDPIPAQRPTFEDIFPAKIFSQFKVD